VSTVEAAGRTALVEGLIERFPQIPPEAVLKEDLLRTGIAFHASALTDNLDGEVKPKSYFIFSFDQKPLAQLGEAARRRPPEELALTGGPHALRRTIVSVRVNPDSPYEVARAADGGLRLSLDGRELADVTLPPMPEYYRHSLANGKTVMETAPTIQWGYLIYLTVLRLCQYFGAKEECRFCDINHNWRQHKQEGRPYTGVKPVEDVLEALALIDLYDVDRASHAYTSRRHCLARRCSATRTTASRSTTRTTRCGTSGCSRSSAPARSATSAAPSGTGASSTQPRCSGRAT